MEVTPKSAPLSPSSDSTIRYIDGSAPDEDFIVQLFAEQSLVVEDAHKQDLFLTSFELQNGKKTKKEFCDLVKCWTKLAGTLTPGVPMAGSHINVVNTVSAAAELMSAIEEVATKIKDRAEADLLSKRYLEGLETARGLAPESVRIVTAIQEVIEDTVDDHEVTFLRAKTLSIRDFLVEDVLPFFNHLVSQPVGTVPKSFIQEMRRKIDGRKEQEKESAYVHLQRAEKGLTQMEGNYHIYTNHIPRYAAACAVEVLLRAYHVLLGFFDPEDPLMENHRDNLYDVAVQRSQKIFQLYKEYMKERASIMTYKFEREGRSECRFYVHDAGKHGDHLIKRVDLSSFVTRNNQIPSRLEDDGVLVFETSPSLFGADRAEEVKHAGFTVLSEVWAKTLEHDASRPIWNTHFKPHVATMGNIVQVACRSRQRLDPLVSSRSSSLAIASACDKPSVKTRGLYELARKDARPRPSDLLGNPLQAPKMASHGHHAVVAVYFLLCHAFGATYPGERDAELCTNVFVADELNTCAAENADVEVIVPSADFVWVAAADGDIPSGAVPVGRDMLYRPLYLTTALVMMGLQWKPGWVRAGMTGCRYAEAGKVVEAAEYLVLCYRTAVAKGGEQQQQRDVREMDFCTHILH